MTVIVVHSHFGEPAPVLADLAAAGRLRILREAELDTRAIAEAAGIVTTMHLDQVGFAAHREALETMLARGGRLFFNGHVVKPFLKDLERYRPLVAPRRPDLDLTRLADHPIFRNVDPASLVTRRGVAGFYGRGHNPPPPGAIAVTGIGPDRLPVDWEWAPPDGGLVFSHAGNDLWSAAGEWPGAARQFAERVVAWTAGDRAA